MNYNRNRRYFSGNGLFWLGVFCIAAGLCIFIFPIIMIIMFALGILFIVLSKKMKVTDEEYDASVLSMLSDVKEKALNKLGIDEDEVKEIAPISISGYEYKNYDLVNPGKDSLWRTNQYKYIMLFFSQNEVHCYTYKFKTTIDNQTEDTDVYFYKDIVSVSTSSETVKINNIDVSYEYFKLTTAGGTSLSVSIRDKDDAQRSINAMRQLLKLKKQA